MNYKTKLKSELPRGSYLRDPADKDQLEMGIWGDHLDKIEQENAVLLESIASPKFASEWMIEQYELQYKITPGGGDTLSERRSKVLTAMSLKRNLNISTYQKICFGFLGYYPNIKTSPHAFYLNKSTFDSGHKLVEDWIKFGFWIELQSAITTKPYDDTNLIASLKKYAPAEVIYIWTFWDDGVFDWNDYNP